jgi:hypothetical protein
MPYIYQAASLVKKKGKVVPIPVKAVGFTFDDASLHLGVKVVQTDNKHTWGGILVPDENNNTLATIYVIHIKQSGSGLAAKVLTGDLPDITITITNNGSDYASQTVPALIVDDLPGVPPSGP